MFRKSLVIVTSLAFAVPLVLAANIPAPQENLSAAEIVNRNVKARGGLDAWRAVQTMSLEGTMGAGGNRRETLPMAPAGGRHNSRQMVPPRQADEVQLPFVMELKRPRKMRFELQFNGQTAVQVFDGTNGWKLRPYLNRSEIEPYTANELKMASLQTDLDGPLVDYVAKGTQIEFAGLEKVEDHDTYKLKLSMKNGQIIHVWIDAQTFLEAKMEGQPRMLDGAYHPVEVYFRDYRVVSGLQIPFVLETKVLPAAQKARGVKDTPTPPEKIVVAKVVVNAKLDESKFSKPVASVAVNRK